MFVLWKIGLLDIRVWNYFNVILIIFLIKIAVWQIEDVHCALKPFHSLLLFIFNPLNLSLKLEPASLLQFLILLKEKGFLKTGKFIKQIFVNENFRVQVFHSVIKGRMLCPKFWHLDSVSHMFRQINYLLLRAFPIVGLSLIIAFAWLFVGIFRIKYLVCNC